MTFEEYLMGEEIGGHLLGGAFGAIAAVGIMLLVLFILAIYVYTSYSWMTIARKLKYKKAWLAWIPIVNIILVLQLGGFHWAWFFLILIPLLGWLALFVLIIIATWRIYEKRRYPGWFSLAPIIPKVGGLLHLIIIGFVAFKDKTPQRSAAPVRKTVKRKAPAKKTKKKKTVKKKRR